MTHNITDDTYVILWSPHQRQFHIEKFQRMLEINMEIFKDASKGDYILLAYAQTQDAAYELTRKFDEYRDKNHRK